MKRLRSAVFLVTAILPLVFLASSSDGRRSATTASDQVHREGVIEGVLRVREIPRRRTAERYPGGASEPQEIQEIPALVYLEGRVPGETKAGTGQVMAQRDKRFEPSLLVVPLGTVVAFPNRDPFFHNVFSYSSPARFDLGRYPQGESKEIRFDQPGIVKLYCEVHEAMRAAIAVVENPYWDRPDEEGRFRIEGVPPGTYTLVAWHTDHRTREVEVAVTPGTAVEISIDL